MRVMVTGSRDWRDIEVVDEALWRFDQGVNMVLINGCASGLDAIARSLALSMGWEPEDYWPDYASYDFAKANKCRNTAMVWSHPDVVLAFPTKNSRGTWHAVNEAKRHGYVLDKTLFIYSERSDFRRIKIVTGDNQA